MWCYGTFVWDMRPLSSFLVIDIISLSFSRLVVSYKHVVNKAVRSDDDSQ